MKALHLPLLSLLLLLRTGAQPALPLVEDVEFQPLAAATGRLLEALQFAGAPLAGEDAEALQSALRDTESSRAVRTIQEILDRHVIAGVHINPESRVQVRPGAAPPRLVEQGWRTFLVKVRNEAGITPRLRVRSPQAAPGYRRSTGSPDPPIDITPDDASRRFLDLAMLDRAPLRPTLSGLELEYRIIQIHSRDRGRREVDLSFDVGQGTQDLGFRNRTPILFDCIPSVELVLRVADFDGTPTTAAFVVRDPQGRVYPNPARRLAPDFFFHDQVYRADGESLRLPPGNYTVGVSRGPEYHREHHPLTVRPAPERQTASYRLRRWIHPLARGWVSGDHHVHAAGCAHYENPTEGVRPADMMRHILGEDLNVGCVLSWGPCWYAQKRYFDGGTSPLSEPRHIMRYDVEVSGFPSSHAGHLCLLRLGEDDYPGTTRIEEWPSWTLPVLQWGREQGGVVGYSHSGWGLALPDYAPDGSRKWSRDGRAADILPDYAMPPFDGIGANEFIVTVAHDACDFISTVDTPAIWELNIWYHTLNCGFRSRISGETDFPCIYGERVGLGRIYVKQDRWEEGIDFDSWAEGLRNGRSYCGDGRSHLLDFRVEGVAVGEPGSGGKVSQLDLEAPGPVRVTLDAAALLEETPDEAIRRRRLDQKPYWHIERCRIGDTRKVPVEIVVNGEPVASRELLADGTTVSMDFTVDLEHSSWIAARILPSAHTNPVFVEVDGQPVRASRRSARWCLDAVDTCWRAKQGRIRPRERDEARAAYERARDTYARILSESVAD